MVLDLGWGDMMIFRLQSDMITIGTVLLFLRGETETQTPVFDSVMGMVVLVCSMKKIHFNTRGEVNGAYVLRVFCLTFIT